MKSITFRKEQLTVFLILSALVWLIYWPVGNFDYVSFDDLAYVQKNRFIKEGITAESVHWAFNLDNKHKTYWHPLTWLSHALDIQLFGLEPGWHHLVNVVFHHLNVLLLYMVFYSGTGALWPSAILAGFFAIHPLHVESVAWIAERKNVLSTSFWLATMLMYFQYAKRANLTRYLCTLLLFILGLTAKPMLVTLPFVLLLMDFWPLQRCRLFAFSSEHQERAVDSIGRLVLEKIPMFILSILTVYITTLSMVSDKIIIGTNRITFSMRLTNAIVSYVKYVYKIFFPFDLAHFYPFPDQRPTWQILGALAALIVFSVFVIRFRRRLPCFSVGWLWFAGTLVPVSGLMQAGLWPEMADRWAYIPSIGIFMMISWGVWHLRLTKKINRPVLISITLVSYVYLGVLCARQVNVWRNDLTLYRHAVQVDPNNHIAHNNLGVAIAATGDLETAIEHYEKALALRSAYASAFNNLGNAYMNSGRLHEAVHYYRQAMKYHIAPEKIYNNLGIVYFKLGLFAKALDNFRQALALNASEGDFHYNIALIHEMNDNTISSAHHLKKCLHLDPDNQSARLKLQRIKKNQQAKDAQIARLLHRLKTTPDSHDLHLQLGRFYRKSRKIDKAIRHLKKADKLNPKSFEIMYNLALALAEAGRYETSQNIFQQLLDLNPNDRETYYYLAAIMAKRQKHDDALIFLQKAIAMGFNDWPRLVLDTNFESLRKEERFVKIIGKK